MYKMLPVKCNQKRCNDGNVCTCKSVNRKGVNDGNVCTCQIVNRKGLTIVISVHGSEDSLCIYNDVEWLS